MSRQDEINSLINMHQRRLQKLKEKEAKSGINTPAEILVEIEDIEKEIERLKSELKPVTESFSPTTDVQGKCQGARIRRNKARDLGDHFLMEERWDKAEAEYESAIYTDELLYLASVAKICPPIEELGTADLFACSAYAQKQSGHYTAAIERLEESSVRALRRIVATDWMQLNRADPVDRRAFEMALERWCIVESEDGDEMQEVHEMLDTAITHIRISIPEFLESNSMSFSSIAMAATTIDTPLIYLSTTPKGSLAFIVVPHGPGSDNVQVVQLDNFTSVDLHRLLFERDADGHITGGYLSARSVGTETLKPILETMLNILGEKLIGPLAAKLREIGLKRGIFIPIGLLNTLPLHAARYKEQAGRNYFIDEFEITYAPGAWALSRLRNTQSKKAKDKFFSAGNGAEAFVQDEAESVSRIAAASASAPTQVLYEPTVTPQLLLDQTSTSRYLHLAYNIKVDIDQPLDSEIVLAEGITLKLADLLSATHQAGTQLVTFLAAQLVPSDLSHFSKRDETFPSSFLEAGVANVVGNLWSVNDLSASLLMKQFYTYYFQKGLAPAAALRRAQCWLREEITAGLAAEVCRRRVEALFTQQTPALAKAINDWIYCDRLKPEDHPFAHPVYWANFIISGS